MRIRLGETSATSVAPHAVNLFAHLSAPENQGKLHAPPQSAEPVRYLTFEDFNTRGLEGDPEQWQPTPGNKNPFFNFFRGEGVTEKSEGKRGRHGVGKMVFTVASRAHAIFGVTSTHSDPPLLMGTSTLWQHHLHAKPFHPDGWFGVTKSVEGNELVVVARDQEHITLFSATFGLVRIISGPIMRHCFPTKTHLFVMEKKHVYADVRRMEVADRFALGTSSRCLMD
ncbi:MAG: hypothetical protein AB7U20_10480 [Planctomycetaceae bacterium]